MTRCALPLAAFLLTGCAADRLCHRPQPAAATVPTAVVQASYSSAAPADAPSYALGCPDVLSVSFRDRPAWDCAASVDVDGCVPLGPVGRVRVEGMTLPAARSAIAAAADVAPDRVIVSLDDPRSTRIYVCGPENHRRRAVPFRGPEPVLDFLWRVGAVKKGCTDLTDVTVVRSHLADGGEPEVMRVDVPAIVLDGDARTNVLLQASDQVMVGETRRSEFRRRVPKWMRPAYDELVGLVGEKRPANEPVSRVVPPG